MKNYALITEGINNILLESYTNKDKKKTQQILKEIKSNKPLKYLITIVNNLKNGEVQPMFVDDFINENIKTAKEMDFSSFDKILKESKSESNELLENIGIILFEEKTVFNLSKYTKAYNVVKTHLVEANTWKENITGKLKTLSTDYSKLGDEDKKLFESFIKANTSEKQAIYSSTKEECLKILKEHIKHSSDNTMKLKLYETKDMILNLSENSDSYIKNMVKLHELKKDLL